MEFTKVRDLIDGVPHMRPPAGRKVYDFVLENRCHNILELGTYHGVSTCYLAAAVDELGSGRVLTIDRRMALRLDPTVLDLARRTGLEHVIEARFAERSFTWELKKMLEAAEPEQFDFIFLDAGHVWDTTGFAFFLADRLLRPGGWLLFDDIEWTINGSSSVSEKSWAREYSEEERATKQIRSVVDLLVATDPRYEVTIDGNWGWARKLAPAAPALARVSTSAVVGSVSSLVRDGRKTARRAARRARRELGKARARRTS